MNKIGKLSFGQQIVPIKSEKSITPKEKAELDEVKKRLDAGIGKDIIKFNYKDANNMDIVVNHPDPKVEKEIAKKLQEMAVSNAITKPQAAPKGLNVVA